MSSTNQTPYYGLSQWKGTDTFEHADFNSDNLAVDTALHNIAVSKPYVIGTYKGTGTTDMISLSIGFKPSAVFIFCDAQSAGQFMMMIKGMTLTSKNNNTSNGYGVAISWNTNGISWQPDANYGKSISVGSEMMNTNNLTYHYMAFR